MADDKLKINAEAQKVENEKTKAQKERADKINERQKEAAEKARAASKKAEEEKAAKEKQAREKAAAKQAENQDDIKIEAEKLVAAGISAGAAALSTKKGGRSFLAGLVLGIVLGVAGVMFMGGFVSGGFTATVGAAKDKADEIISDTFYGFTVADFQNAILGEASQHQELIVMEQPISVPTTITKAGFGNLEIFSKVKTMTYYGTGVYTIDLSHIDADHITLDEEEKVVTISVPHTVLQYVNYDIDKTEFEDTEKGLLSFGDIALTQEQQKQLEMSVNNAMRSALSEQALMNQADDYGKYKVWEIFYPVVSAVSPEYIVEIVIE